MLDWDKLAEEIKKHRPVHTHMVAVMPLHPPVRQFSSLCEGIESIRDYYTSNSLNNPKAKYYQGANMKKHNPTIVSVSYRKVDAREAEARELIEWAKSLPTKNLSNPLLYTLVLGQDDRPAVERLVVLADTYLDIWVPGAPLDFLRVFSDKGTKRFSVCYMEYFAGDHAEDEHYSPSCTQHYDHIVDALQCLKLRLDSTHPYKPAKV